MLRTSQTQSVSDFRANYAETLERINESGDAEILTVKGQARAVLMSPAVYDQIMREVQLMRDVAMIRKSVAAHERGESIPAETFFADLRSKLEAMKNER